MKKIKATILLSLTLFFVVSAQSNEMTGTFINPAFQIGYSFDKGYFYGFQLSVNKGVGNNHIAGVSYGVRKYNNETDYNHYIDLQHGFSGAIGYGLGLNFVKNAQGVELTHYRSKGWAGFITLATVDVMIPANNTQEYVGSMGMVATLPIQVNESSR